MGNRDRKLSAVRRIKRRQDYLRIQQNGDKYRSKHFLLILSLVEDCDFSSDNGLSIQSRLGVTVTRRVDKRAVRRNRLKRRVREFFRLMRERFLYPVDMVVIGLSGSNELDYHEVHRELSSLLGRAGVIARRQTRTRGGRV